MKKTYKAKEPLRHDGEMYAPGDPVEMSPALAAPLIEIKVLEEPGAVATAPRPNVPDSIAAVKAAATIEELDALVEGEDRKGVLAVIEARRKELEA